jgi:phosphohistidine phosphatase
MNLLLWRHAEAQDTSDPALDHQRKLTPRGEKQAARMARWLDRQLPHGTRVWVSPATRAEQTAMALGRSYKVCPELAPEADLRQALELIQWPRNKGHLVLVGHQPLLGQLLASLLNVSPESCPIKKGSIWWLRYKEQPAPSKTVLLTVQTPDTL